MTEQLPCYSSKISHGSIVPHVNNSKPFYEAICEHKITSTCMVVKVDKLFHWITVSGSKNFNASCTISFD